MTTARVQNFQDEVHSIKGRIDDLIAYERDTFLKHGKQGQILLLILKRAGELLSDVEDFAYLPNVGLEVNHDPE